MSSRHNSAPGPVREALTFWLIVIVLSAAAGVVSFRVGRDWLGKRLAGVEVSGSAPRIVAQSRVDPEEAARTEAESRAPAKPVVTVEDREPTAQERRKAQGKDPSDPFNEPQDGAQANQDPKRGKPPDDAQDEARQDKPKQDEGKAARAAKPDVAAKPDAGHEPRESARGKYVVTAGSYADSENAAKVMARLSAKGYSPYVETIKRNGKTLRRVNVAVVKGREKAQDLRDELAGSGLDAGVSPTE